MIISGTDLRIVRLGSGKTTNEMADIAGVKTRKTYENWEKNKGAPSMNQFLRMVQHCGFDASVLVKLYMERDNFEERVDVMSARLEQTAH